MSDPDFVTLTEASYDQIIDELKRRHVGGIIGTVSEIKDRMTGAHAWGPTSLRAGLMFILYEMVRKDVSQWGEEFVQEWNDPDESPEASEQEETP